MEKFENTNRTVEEELYRERKFWKQNQLWTALLAFVAIFCLLGGSGLSVATGAAELTLTMHDGSTEAVEYADMVSAELLENADYGTVTEGKDTRQGKSGIWEHPAWGSYTLCVYASCDLAVQIRTEDGCYVVNLASEAETRQLYQFILDKMPANR